MGLGILPDRHLGENVPGTSLLDDLYRKGPSMSGSEADAGLKRSNRGIVLVPQSVFSYINPSYSRQ